MINDLYFQHIWYATHILHTTVEFELVACMQTNEKNSVNMFKMSIGTSEPTKGGGEQGVAYVAYV